MSPTHVNPPECSISEASDHHLWDEAFFDGIDLDNIPELAPVPRALQTSVLSSGQCTPVPDSLGQRMSGVSRNLMSEVRNNPFPYELGKSPPDFVFALFSRPQSLDVGALIDDDKLLEKRSNLRKLLSFIIEKKYNLALSAKQTDMDSVLLMNFKLPPVALINNDPDLSRTQYRFVESGWYGGWYFSDMVKRAADKDVWVVCSDRSLGLLGWKAWASYMSKCSPTSMFGFAFWCVVRILDMTIN